MLKEIKEQLSLLENSRGIKVLLAVESGSRAWGFPSPDSDFDVRIIYHKPQSWYLNINTPKDTIDYFHGELLDISGWDLRKTLRLLSKSNATPAEWVQSPIVYQVIGGFQEQLLDYVKAYFNPSHTLNHYRGIALNSYRSISDEKQIKLKKLFYVLRPILAARWIIKYQSVPPMAIAPLLEELDHQEIASRISSLIELKATVDEGYVIVLEDLLQNFIEASLLQIKNADLHPKEPQSIEPLNKFFQALISPQR